MSIIFSRGQWKVVDSNGMAVYSAPTRAEAAKLAKGMVK